VGIVDHIEDRIVGLKVRDIYEVPAATLILTAHAELERLVCTIHQNQFKGELDRKWGYLVYAGCGGSRCARTSTPTWTRSTGR
jgi:argininosuccinate synthase